MALSSPSHYLLLGLGKERLLALLIFMVGFFGIIIAYIGITIFGIYGIILGKTTLAMFLFAKNLFIRKSLAKDYQNDLNNEKI